jgi:PadR family transcriptional regulator AphA
MHVRDLSIKRSISGRGDSTATRNREHRARECRQLTVRYDILSGVARVRDDDGISLAEHVCLALIVQEPRHGWSVVRALAPDSDLGRVWSLSRPLTYRAIDGLVDRKLVVRKGQVPGDGPMRQMLSATPAGKRATRAWLAAPVEHVRDVRTELLLKLVLLRASGRDPRPLLRAQEIAFEPIFASLQHAARVRGADDVDRWRYESSVAVRRFIASTLSKAERSAE